MIRTRVFDLLEERGQKQRWLLAKLKSRGYRVSESYLSQIKAGIKEPSLHFIHAVCEVLEMPESKLFYVNPERKQKMKAKTAKKVTVSAPARKDAKQGKGKINVAIVGVGNCSSSLVQGRYFYENAKEDEFVPGLMHVNLGGYHIRDINFVAAIDIDQNKVGKDLSQAIFTTPNNTYKFCDVPHQGVRVARGMTHDGLGKYLSQIIKKSKGGTEDIVKLLKDTDTHVVVSYLPVGSEEATKWYVEQVLAAGCGFVNCVPVFIARDQYGYWPRRFREAGLPIVGDDIKSQLGATITHRVMTHLFRERGVRLDRTYQLNFGGNTDFLNMLERERLESKKISKTNAVTSQLDYVMPATDVHVGPSDYVPWLTDRKFCYIQMEGTTFGNVPLRAEIKLEVWDSPNSAGVVIDAIRCCKIGLDRGISGPLLAPSSYFMKSPPEQYSDSVAHDKVEEFIRG
jgi:myo-inositol-1-phosphate synthase